MKEISKAIGGLKTEKEVYDFLNEILTEPEEDTLKKRWQIVKMLYHGYTQRDIAQKLGVSLCKVTRGAKILKKKNSVIKKCLKREQFPV